MRVDWRLLAAALPPVVCAALSAAEPSGTAAPPKPEMTLPEGGAPVTEAVALRNEGDPEAALAELDQVDTSQLSAFAGLVTNLRQSLEEQVAGGGTTATTAAP